MLPNDFPPLLGSNIDGDAAWRDIDHSIGVERDVNLASFPFLSSLDDSLFDVASYLDSESLSPTEFYARRSAELRVAADESAARYSRHTLVLAMLGLLGCIAFYQSVFAGTGPRGPRSPQLPPERGLCSGAIGAISDPYNSAT